MRPGRSARDEISHCIMLATGIQVGENKECIINILPIFSTPDVRTFLWGMERFQMALGINSEQQLCCCNCGPRDLFSSIGTTGSSSPAIKNLGILSMHQLTNNHSIYIYKFTINYYPIINQIFVSKLNHNNIG